MPMVAGIQGPDLILWPRHPPQPGIDIVNHAVQTELPAVLRGVDLLHPMALQGGNFLGRNRTATANHHADMLVAALAEHVYHVGEILVVPALVGTYSDAVGILLDGGTNDIGD